VYGIASVFLQGSSWERVWEATVQLLNPVSSDPAGTGIYFTVEAVVHHKFQAQHCLSCLQWLLPSRTILASQDLRYSCWYVCESYNKAKRWTVPCRNGRWQRRKGCWGSETPCLHGVSCESVDWNPYSSIGFARQCGFN
jgi:hypothetical protein